MPLSKIKSIPNKKWIKYYTAKENLYAYIEKNTDLLRQDFPEGKYVRAIRYCKDCEVMETIAKDIENLDKIFKEIVNKNAHHVSCPVIIKDVENININFLPAFKSLKVTKETTKKKNGILQLWTVTELEGLWGEKFEENRKKYNLKYATENLVGYDYESLLEFAKVDYIQARKKTGYQAIASVRKIGESKSKRYKYGLIIVDKIPNINVVNKEGPHLSNRLEKKYKKFELEIPTSMELYIKK